MNKSCETKQPCFNKNFFNLSNRRKKQTNLFKMDNLKKFTTPHSGHRQSYFHYYLTKAQEAANMENINIFIFPKEIGFTNHKRKQNFLDNLLKHGITTRDVQNPESYATVDEMEAPPNCPAVYLLTGGESAVYVKSFSFRNIGYNAAEKE
jgi:hypothetical protein